MFRADAVMCDLDLLLINSRPYWEKFERATIEWLGGEYNDELSAAASALDDPKIIRLFIEKTGGKVEFTDAWAFWQKVVEPPTAQDLVPMAGAVGFVERLGAADVELGLVTSSDEAFVQPVLEFLGRDNFDVVVHCEHVINTKPHPEPYLLAAAMLGVAPQRCVAIEDSGGGIHSAEQAEYGRVVGVPSLKPLVATPTRIVVPSLNHITDSMLGIDSTAKVLV